MNLLIKRIIRKCMDSENDHELKPLLIILSDRTFNTDVDVILTRICLPHILNETLHYNSGALNISCVDSLTSRLDICVSKVSLRHQQTFKSDLRFLLQSLMFRFPLKQASQHGSTGLSVVSPSSSNCLVDPL